MALMPRPFYNWSTYPGHGGIDYPYPRGTAVMASGPGVIDFDGYYSAAGGYAKFIQYDNGQRHGYYHFDNKWGLTVGDRVNYGTVFARVGSLGQNSTGPHLHHEVWDGYSYIIKPPAYWNYVDQNSYVGDGSGAGGGSTPIEENDMNSTESMQLDAVYKALFGANNGPTGGAAPLVWTDIYGVSKTSTLGVLDIVSQPVLRDGNQIAQIQDNADTNTMVRELIARPAAVITDEQIALLAAELAEAGVGGATQAQVEAIVKAAFDSLVLSTPKA